MTPKQLAVLDIKEDLKQQGKCFIAFKTNLNPSMRRLVRDQIREQTPFGRTVRKTQLVAHCLFCITTGEVKFNNYSRYYGASED